MAERYVYHGGSNTSPYDTWAKAATLLATGCTGAAVGDRIWVASDHAESSASAQTITFPGSDTSPSIIMSVSRAGSTPPVAADIAAGAVVTTTGTNAIALGGSGSNYVYGITFNCGTGSGQTNFGLAANSNGWPKYDTCAFNIVSTNASSRFQTAGGTGSLVDFVNCTASVGSTSQGFTINGDFRWVNKPGSTAITGATIPTGIFKGLGNRYQASLSGLDLSAMGSGTTLVEAGANGLVQIINCKLNASVTVAATPTNPGAKGTYLIGSGSSTIAARNEIYLYTATLTTETTIKRTAGASDGTTAYSWKVVTSANAERTHPFETFEGALWNADTGSSKALTVHCVTDNVTLTDAEIWLEVEYLGSSATPVATLITDAPATALTAGSNQASDSGEAWTTTGLTTPVKQKLEVTFTPEMVGPIRWRVKVAKASTTVYIDPNADLA